MTIPNRFIVALLAVTASFASAATPRGAVSLPASSLKTEQGIACGKIRNSWEPGRMIRGSLFYPLSSERENLVRQARSARGKKKDSLQRRANSLKTNLAQRRAICRRQGSSSVRFDLSGAVGLALRSTSSVSAAGTAPASNLKKVNAAGQIEEAILSGRAIVSQFFVAPNDKLYVLYATRADIDGTSCLLAEVDTATGLQTCVESELVSITWRSSMSYNGNDPIQFDSSGAIYYVGMKPDWKYAVRRYLNGQRTDLINDNIFISDFFVLPDGRVLVSGRTVSTQVEWVRKISPQGSLSNIHTVNSTYFMLPFPDGNVYFGTRIDDPPDNAVLRYLADVDSVDGQPWIGAGGFGAGLPFVDGVTPHHSRWPICIGQNPPNGFCSTGGVTIRSHHATLSGKVFVIAGATSTTDLMQYYPTVGKVTTVIKRPSLLRGVLNHLFVAGTDSAEHNILTLLDTDTSAEQPLLGENSQIEIYHLSYSAAKNKMMFDGLRFSDNSYVIGQVDLNTLEVTAAATGSTKLEDFAAF